MRNFITNVLPVYLYAAVGLAYIFQGVRYLIAPELMAYHLNVLDVPWKSLDASQQTLFLGLLKGFGAGAFGVGLAVALLALIPLRSGRNWARWVTPVVALLYTGALVYVTSFALLPGAAPIAVAAALHAIVILAAVTSVIGIDTSSHQTD